MSINNLVPIFHNSKFIQIYFLFADFSMVVVYHYTDDKGKRE